MTPDLPTTLSEIATDTPQVKRLAKGALHWGNDGRHLRAAVAEVVAAGGSCFLCGKAFSRPRDAQIDHDHETGAVRGILCRDCNMGLGCFKDNHELVYRAWLYLTAEPEPSSEL